MNGIRNERVKLLAQVIGNLSVATAATGVITPVVAILYGTAPLSATLFPVTPTLFFIAFAFHVVAQPTLGRLRDVRYSAFSN